MKKNKFELNNRIIILVVVFLSLVQITIAIPNSISIQGKLTNTAGTIQTGTFNFTFRIYDSFTSGNLLYGTNVTSTTDSRGVYDIILKNVNISFEEQLYLAVKVNNDAEMEPRVNLTSVPYTFRANISDDLNKNKSYTAANLNATGNITLGDRLTFGLGQFIDNLVNGMLKLTGALNVTSGLIVGGGLNVSEDFRVNQQLNITSAGNLITTGSINASGTVQGFTLTDGNVTITSGVLSAAQVNVGGGFTGGGMTLQGADIITQGDILFSGNITVINVTFLSTNGSIMPSLDNSFDVGNGSFRWRNANFSGTLFAATIDGTNVRVNGRDVQVAADAWNFANNGTFVLDNGTIVRTTNLRIALSNNTDANFINLTVVSLALGWSNLSNYPSACPSGQFITTIGDTVTCASPSLSAAGGWTDDGDSIRLTTFSDSVSIGSNLTGEKLILNGSFRIDNSTTPVFFVNASAQRVGIGLTLPNDALEVVGNARVSGSLNATGINASRLYARNGTAAAPPYTFIEDADNGIRLAGVNNISIVTGGSDRLSIDGNGNITAQPGAKFVGNGTVPTGMIAFFASTSCPAGWTEYTAARGRAIVALVASGTAAGTVGTALTNQEDRTHTHTGPSHTHGAGTLAGPSHTHGAGTLAGPSHTHTFSDTVSSSTDSGGAHTHGYSTVIAHTHAVDPPSTASGGVSVGHTHAVDPPSTSTSSDGPQSGSVAVQGGTGQGVTDQGGLHSHTVDIGSFTSGAQSVDHTHSTDIGSFTSGSTGSVSATTDSGGAHTHTMTDFTASGTTSASGTGAVTGATAADGTGAVTGATAADGTGSTGTAATSSVMPYIQLLACQAP